MDLKFRFTLFFSAVCLVLLSIFSSLVYRQVKEKSFLQAEQDLKALAEHEWEHLELPSHQAASKTGTPHFKDVYLRIWKEGILLYNTFPKGMSEETHLGTIHEEKRLFHTIARTHNGHKYQISGLYDLSAILMHLNYIRKVLIFGCIIALLLIIPLSYFSTHFLLRPFRVLAEGTSQLNAEHLSFRFKQPKNLDEYGILTRNFNLLLDRLQKSFNQVQTFAVNASHELRTPLSVIIGQGEMAIRKPSSDVTHYIPIIQKMLQSAKSLRDVINRLFFLAEVERIEQENQKTEISVSDVIYDVVEGLHEPYRNNVKEISILGNEQTTILGNRELFSSIITNLVENAVKYSKKRVQIHFEKNNSQFQLTIDDDGPGIEVNKREAVFEPFFRILKANEHSASSHGLGLSIVKACIDAEHGAIWLSDSSLGGLSVKVSIPCIA